MNRFDQAQWAASTAALIEKHAADFVAKHCVVEKLFVDALNDYYRLVGEYEDIERYYKSYAEPYINVAGAKYDRKSGSAASKLA